MSPYNEQVVQIIARQTKPLQGHMKTSILNPFDPISIIAFLPLLKLACDTSDAHELAAIWILYFFMKKQDATVLSLGIVGESSLG